MIKGTLEKPEKWETCLNILKYEPDRILLTHKCPGSHKRKGGPGAGQEEVRRLSAVERLERKDR